MINLNFDIVSHCNLNCCCCGHFSPIAEKKYMPMSIFAADCRKLSQLTGGKVDKFVLLGGEPLLHPEIEMFMQTASLLFEAEFSIDSNALLLPKMSDSFWNSCKKYNFSINVTRYPINIDYDACVEIGRRYGVSVNITGSNNDKEPRIWFHNYRDIKGTQDSDENYRKCKWHNKCINICYGKTATCILPLMIDHFNKKYGNTFHVSEEDVVNIDEIDSLEDLMDRLSKPIPFCRYCRPDAEKQIVWQTSKKNMSEWI